MKINLVLNKREVLVFDVKDSCSLRNNYRIIGELIGNLNSVPVLPLKLLPEEVSVLIEKNIAQVILYKKEENRNTNEELETNLLKEQRVLYKSNRRKQLEGIFDKIVACKRKNGDERPELEIFQDELEKSCQIEKDKMIWPIMLKPSNTICEEVHYDAHHYTSHLRCEVYKNLWEKGYYITSGQKFGGDFLVYLGDPIVYHAIFIVRCVANIASSMKPHEIVAFGRLGSSVKKKAVLAALVDQQVSYITINWIDDWENC